MDTPPPTFAAVIKNVTAFKGQNLVEMPIPVDLLYDPYDNVTIYALSWYFNNTIVSKFLRYDNLQSKIVTKLFPDFVGTWVVDVVGTDSILQSIKISAFINGNSNS